MEENVEINKHKRKVNRWGVYISICFIVAGVLWYAVNVGIIPYIYIQQQLGPIIVVLIGLLILIKSV